MVKFILSIMEIDESARLRLIQSLEPGWEYRPESEISEDELELVEVLLFGRTIDVEKLRPLKNLRMMQSFAAGVDQVDFTAIPKDVIVCSNAGAFGGPIAEFILGAVISLGRNFELHDNELRSGKFIKRPVGVYLRGKTIGVLGTGGIGQGVAQLAKSFGMRTIGINTSGGAVHGFDEITTMGRLDSVLKRSDVIVIALPLTLKTRNLLGRAEFQLVKPTCIVVNVARGAIINQEALYDFLRNNPDSRAALDVWWTYPKPGDEAFVQDYPISSLPNVLSSPHNCDGVEEQLKLGSDGAVDNIIRYITKSEPLKGVVHREDYVALP